MNKDSEDRAKAALEIWNISAVRRERVEQLFESKAATMISEEEIPATTQELVRHYKTMHQIKMMKMQYKEAQYYLACLIGAMTNQIEEKYCL